MTGTLLKRLEQHICRSSQKHVLPPQGALCKSSSSRCIWFIWFCLVTALHHHYQHLVCILQFIHLALSNPFLALL